MLIDAPSRVNGISRGGVRPATGGEPSRSSHSRLVGADYRGVCCERYWKDIIGEAPGNPSDGPS